MAQVQEVVRDAFNRSTASSAKVVSDSMLEMQALFGRMQQGIERANADAVTASVGEVRAEGQEMGRLLGERIDAADGRVASLANVIEQQRHDLLTSNAAADAARERIAAIERGLQVLR